MYVSGKQLNQTNLLPSKKIKAPGRFSLLNLKLDWLSSLNPQRSSQNEILADSVWEITEVIPVRPASGQPVISQNSVQPFEMQPIKFLQKNWFQSSPETEQKKGSFVEFPPPVLSLSIVFLSLGFTNVGSSQNSRPFTGQPSGHHSSKRAWTFKTSNHCQKGIHNGMSTSFAEAPLLYAEHCFTVAYRSLSVQRSDIYMTKSISSALCSVSLYHPRQNPDPNRICSQQGSGVRWSNHPESLCFLLIPGLPVNSLRMDCAFCVSMEWMNGRGWMILQHTKMTTLRFLVTRSSL